mmetsp:Transcript_30237/g.92891  ORF Transcript_30237/g.92891 Transcript_30237/m.92891 type:complete len:83 (-) Transcript_30237:1238-1486(-)
MCTHVFLLFGMQRGNRRVSLVLNAGAHAAGSWGAAAVLSAAATPYYLSSASMSVLVPLSELVLVESGLGTHETQRSSRMEPA